jgi:hypothetical protein
MILISSLATKGPPVVKKMFLVIILSITVSISAVVRVSRGLSRLKVKLEPASFLKTIRRVWAVVTAIIFTSFPM